MSMSRRMVFRGLGGLTLSLPILESLAPRESRAADPDFPPYGIFFRQANGVAAEQNTSEIGAEPERFWPTQTGALSESTVQGRALDELTPFLSKVLAVSGVNMETYDFGDGHARGALQGLTAVGPQTPGQGGSSEAGGESLDHRMGAELNDDGRESLFLYCGRNSGWLGGACISHRGAGQRRAPIHNPLVGYQQIMGLDSTVFADLIARQRSVNDLVKAQMDDLMSKPRLSSQDKERLEVHRAAIRDLENNLTCNFADSELAEFEGQAAIYDSTDGDEVLATARAHMQLAALAVACGYTRSVAIQVGNGNDGNTQYRDPDSGQPMENFHYVSHRRLSHGADGTVIPGSDVLHHKIDRQFAATFRYLLEQLEARVLPSGGTLLDAGFACWYNDLGNGPAHSPNRTPWIIGGSAGGFLKQGQYLQLPGQDWTANHARMLNTLGSAAGLRDGNEQPISDFGDPAQDRTVFPELLA